MNKNKTRKPTRTKRVEPLVPFVVRVPAEVKDELSRVAADAGESVNTVVRVAIREHLRRGRD